MKVCFLSNFSLLALTPATLSGQAIGLGTVLGPLPGRDPEPSAVPDPGAGPPRPMRGEKVPCGRRPPRPQPPPAAAAQLPLPIFGAHTLQGAERAGLAETCPRAGPRVTDRGRHSGAARRGEGRAAGGTDQCPSPAARLRADTVGLYWLPGPMGSAAPAALTFSSSDNCSSRSAIFLLATNHGGGGSSGHLTSPFRCGPPRRATPTREGPTAPAAAHAPREPRLPPLTSRGRSAAVRVRGCLGGPGTGRSCLLPPEAGLSVS